MPVPGDTVRTGPGESLVIGFGDGSSIELAGDTEVVVGHTPARSRRPTTVRLPRGEVRAIIEPGGGPFELETPAGVASVTGTQFMVSVRAERAVLVVLEGSVDFRNALGRVTVADGQRTEATPAQPPAAPRTVEDALWRERDWAVGLVEVPPGEPPPEPGVTDTIHPAVPTVYAEAVPAVVRVAREAFDALFADLSLDSIQVVVIDAPGYYERTTTDRRSAIYVTVGAKGLGEAFRPDAGPVAILCESVAELRNPWGLPGFNRYIAHTYLVPAVIEELGTDVLPNTRLAGPPNDPTGLAGVMADPLYATVHPDYAAAWALAELDARLGLDGLKELLYDIPEGADDALLLLRGLAVAKDAALADVFAMYDVATALELDEEESCLVASFEEDESLLLDPFRTIAGVGELPLLVSNELHMSHSDEWATHGDVSLKLRADTVRRHLSVRIVDPDWRFKDWTQFGRFEMDLLLEADEPQEVRIRANDAAGESHGMIAIWPGRQMQPGQAHHISFPLTPAALAGEAMWRVPYYDGQTRASEISDFCVHLPDPTGPFTLYLDNIRLVPRDEDESAGETPATAGVTTTFRETVRSDYAEGVPAVVATARAAFDALFPELSLDTVQVVMNRAPGLFEHTTTDRDDTIYITVGPKGLGEHWRPDAGPVAILCESVVELGNRRRLSGWERYLAHKYLVPAVIDELGTDVLPDARLDGGADDPTGMLAVMADPHYASVHPDYAAAWALLQIDERLGFDGLKALVYDLAEGADDPLTLLREAAVARDATLADAFAMYDAATALAVDDQGACLVASFEADEPLLLDAFGAIPGGNELPIACVGDVEVARSDVWATDGEFSLELSVEEADEFITMHIVDADWKFQDWARFSRIEMDLLLVADEPKDVRIGAGDDPWGGHGWVPLMVTRGPIGLASAAPPTSLEPGEERHVSVELTPTVLSGRRSWKAPFFEGQARVREIADLFVQFQPSSGPLKLYVDNIRLVPKRADAPAETGDVPGESTPVGRLDEAEGALRRAIQIDPDNPEARRVLAWVLVELGRKTEAAEEFRRVLELTEDAAVRNQVEKALERLE